MSNEKLIQSIKNETQQLKLDYMNKTVEWANSDFDRYFERSRWSTEDWCKFLGIVPDKRVMGDGKEHVAFPKNFYNTSKSKELYREQQTISSVLRVGKNSYVQKALQQAHNHYEDSVKKLFERVNTKGLNEDNISIKSTYLNHNLECVLTDGQKTIRAFTVLAFGPVQRPHYRYLIK